MSINLVNSILEQNAIKYADVTAVTDVNRQLSYRQLNEQANQLAHLLEQAGVDPQVQMAVWSSGCSTDVIVANAAIFKLGGVFLPLDSQSPIGRNLQILHQAMPRVFICNTEDLTSLRLLLEQSGEYQEAVIVVREGEIYQWGKGFALNGTVGDLSKSNLDRDIDPESAAYLYFTSGSTGKPKGVLGAHDSLAHFIQWEIATYNLDKDTRVSQLIALSFDASLRDIWVPLCCGGTLLIPSASIRSSTDDLMGWIAEHKINLVHTVPSLFRLFTKALEQNKDYVAALNTHLSHILLSGEPVFSKDISQWRAVMGPSVAITNLYGPTETTMIRTFHQIEALPENLAQVLPVGQPIADTMIAVVNNGHLCTEGETGEIYIKTPYATKGYLNQPELTAEVFVPNPLTGDAQDLVYKTGDMGRILPSGDLEVLGRLDTQVKVNGIRVELHEVELLIRQVEDIEEAIVIARKNEQNHVELIGYYTGKVQDSLQLKQRMKQHLWQGVVPAWLIHLDEFPLTFNGKIDRKALPQPEQFLNPDSNEEPPKGETEEQLHDFFCTILGLEQVGRNQSFMVLGGTSLKVIQLISRISKKFNVMLTIKEVFTNSSIKELAVYLGEKEKACELELIELPEAANYELSHAQRRLWILDQLEQGLAAYNMSFAVSLSGDLNTRALQWAFREVVRKHKSLRTCFVVVDGEPRQQIDELSRAHELEIIENQGESDAWLSFQINNASQQVFDISQGPLYSAKVYRRGEGRAVLAFVIHHLIFDGYSYRIFIDELTTLYNQYIEGNEQITASSAIDYKDYAGWQNQRLSLGKFKEDEAYWAEQFQDAAPRAELPMDMERSGANNYQGKTLSFTLSPEVSAALRRWQEGKECNLLTVLIASMQALFYRYTQNPEMVFGTLVAGRERPELESQMGYYVNTLAVKTQIPECDTFNNLIEETKERLLQAFDHQYYPFDKIEELIDLESSANRGKLFDIMVILQSQEIVVSEGDLFNGLVATDYPLARKHTKFDLTFNFFENPEDLHLQLEYSTELFSEGWIRRMFDHFQQLVLAFTEKSDDPLRHLDYLSDGEKTDLLEKAQGQVIPVPNEDVISLFRKQALLHADETAVTSTDKQLTYDELDVLSDQLANYLYDQHAVRQGTRVVYSAERDSRMIATMLAVWKINGTYVPIDPANPVIRVAHILEESKPALVITDVDTVDKETYQVITPSDLMKGALATKFNKRTIYCESDDIAYVLYTSGSTGVPKGVEVHHFGMLNHLMAKINDLKITEADTIAQNASIGFDISIWQAMAGLLSGAGVVVYNQETTLNIPGFLSQLKQDQVTILEIVPSYLQVVCEVEEMAEASSKLEQLRLLLVTGEALQFKSLQRWLRLYPGTPVVNAYGPTEASDDITHQWFNRLPTKRKIPIGKPLQNLQVLVLDNEMNLCPQGVIGEICVAGFGVTKGYVNRPEQTELAFVDNPHHKHKRYRKLYRTGDLGRLLSDGSIEFLGRKDFQVKYKGNRIELSEIDQHLTGLKGIDSAVAVLGKVNDQEQLVAFVVGDTSIKLEAIKAHLLDRLPSYMIPDAVEFIASYPLTDNGKVDRKQLVSRTAELDLKTGASVTTKDFTATQKSLNAIWQDILGVYDINLDDHFFHMGGHSLRATRMYTAIYKTFGVLVELAEIFANPTLRELSRLIDSKNAALQHKIQRLQDQPHYELSHLQQQFWMEDTLLGRDNQFNQVEALAYHGSIEASDFEQTMRLLIERHDILRASFKIVKGAPRMFIHTTDEAAGQFSFMDVSDMPDPEKALIELAESLINLNFNLKTGDTFRVYAVRVREGYHVLLFATHHIVSDGWSLQVLGEDFLTIFNTVRKNNQVSMEPLPFQFQDYAAWHNEMIQFGLNDSKHWWRNRFPLDYEAVVIPGLARTEKSPAGHVYSFTIDKATSQNLTNLAADEDSTLYMLLQTVLKVWLYKNARQKHIAIGSPVAGRNLPDLENQLGPYIQVVPILSEVDEDDSFKTLLGRVKQDTLDSFGHQLYPADLARSGQAQKRTGGYFNMGFTLHSQIEQKRFQVLQDREKWSSYDLSDLMTQTSNLPCDLWILVNAIDGELQCKFLYDPNRFNTSLVEHYVAQLKHLLTYAISMPEGPIANWELERHETIAEPVHFELDL